MLKKYLTVFFVSMVHLIELRGAIPYGVIFGLPLWSTYIIAIIGNMIPVPFIFLFARKILEWGADKPVIGKFFTFCLEKGHKGGQKLKATAGRGLFIALLLFVGIAILFQDAALGLFSVGCGIFILGLCVLLALPLWKACQAVARFTAFSTKKLWHVLFDTKTKGADRT